MAAASGPSLVLGLAMISLLMMLAYNLHIRKCHLSVRSDDDAGHMTHSSSGVPSQEQPVIEQHRHELS